MIAWSSVEGGRREEVAECRVQGAKHRCWGGGGNEIAASEVRTKKCRAAGTRSVNRQQRMSGHQHPFVCCRCMPLSAREQAEQLHVASSRAAEATKEEPTVVHYVDYGKT